MIKFIIAIFLTLLFTAEALAYNLLTITYGGTVSVVKGLTKKQCEFAMNRALGLPATAQEKREAKQREEAELKRINDWWKAHPDEAEKHGIGFHADGTRLSWDEAFKKYGHAGVGGCGYEPYEPCIMTYRDAGDIETAECFK